MWRNLYRSVAALLADRDPAILAALPPWFTAADSHDRVPTAIVVRTFRRLAEEIGDPDLGLHAAERATLGTFEVIDFATRSSQDLGDALQRTCRYYQLINDAGTLALAVAGGTASVTHRSDASRSDRRHAVEFLLGSIACRCRQLTAGRWAARRVEFAHPRPAEVTAHTRVFGVAAEFGAEVDTIGFDASLLALPIATAEPVLAGVLDRYVA